MLYFFYYLAIPILLLNPINDCMQMWTVQGAFHMLKSLVKIHLQSVGRNWKTSCHMTLLSPATFETYTLRTPRCPPSSPFELNPLEFISGKRAFLIYKRLQSEVESHGNAPSPCPQLPNFNIIIRLVSKAQKSSLFHYILIFSSTSSPFNLCSCKHKKHQLLEKGYQDNL